MGSRVEGPSKKKGRRRRSQTEVWGHSLRSGGGGNPGETAGVSEAMGGQSDGEGALRPTEVRKERGCLSYVRMTKERRGGVRSLWF